VLLPQQFAPDTSVAASITFYHGGGRFVAPGLSFEYGFIDPDYFPGSDRPADWVPGSPSCLPIRAAGWEARFAASTRTDGITRAKAWFRRPQKPRHWLYVESTSRDSADLNLLVTMLAGVIPDSTLWLGQR
jgi:hypothetical protein